MPEIMKTQVMDMVYDQIEDVFEEGTEEREQFDQAMEVWAASPAGNYGTIFNRRSNGSYRSNRRCSLKWN